MASKKLKKALAIGIGAGLGAKFLASKARAASIATNEAKEAGFGNMKKNYITKKIKKDSFKDKAIKATKKVFKENINLGPGKNATSKKGGTLAGDYGVNTFSDASGFPMGSKTGKMIKARGGKLVNLKPTKLY